MDIRPETQIQSVIKAMIDVVLPAVDAENKMAQEQARLIVGTLQLVAKRLPLAFLYDCDELDRYVKHAEDLVPKTEGHIDGTLRTELTSLAALGRNLLDRAGTAPTEIEAAIFELRTAIGLLIQDANRSAPAGVKEAVRKSVLEMSKLELERELALVADMGFETDPAKRPEPIEQQLRQRRGR